jgi:hypothetical protein
MADLSKLSDEELLQYKALFETSGKRMESVKVNNFDLKYAYHSVRLSLEIEQVLEYGTIDLRRDKEIYKAIRRGDWKLDQVKKWLAEKERALNNLYEKSTLRYSPDRAGVKQLLLDCLEQYFGSLEKCEFHNPDKYQTVVEQIRELIK